MSKSILYCTSHVVVDSAKAKAKELRELIKSGDNRYSEEYKTAKVCDYMTEHGKIYARVRLYYK